MNDIVAADVAGMDVGHLLGTWRRFGAVGPVYEIIDSGEEVSYRLTEILDDPRER
jgi:hypothetical protein